MNKYGKVVLVGAGPGDLDLLTLKGKEYLSQADCVVYDRLLNNKMLGLCKSNSEMIFVGKENHNHTMAQDKINELLYEKAKEHKLVVRLKGGDPYVFGRGGEEALYLKERNIDVETVPGVSSSIAALADAGIPITHRGLSKGFQVITAHSKKDEPTNIDFSLLTDEDVTLVFLMGLAHVGQIAKGLIEAGRDSHTNAAVVSSGTTNHQKKVVGTLENIEDLVSKAKLTSPAIIVVGKVVGLADELNFFEKRPLFGKTFFLPQIESFNYSLEKGVTETYGNELEDRLWKSGAEVISVVTGRVRPIECDLGFLNHVKQGDLVVFTSGNGVRSFFWNLFEIQKKDVRAIVGLKFAVVGEKTKAVLKSFGVNADIVPKVQTGLALAEALKDSLSEHTNIFWLCGSIHYADFENVLGKNYSLKKIVCYENNPAEYEISDEICSKILKCDGAIFTSASNAQSVITKGVELPENIYSIGPSCSGVLKKHGVAQVVEAKSASYEGLFDLLVE